MGEGGKGKKVNRWNEDVVFVLFYIKKFCSFLEHLEDFLLLIYLVKTADKKNNNLKGG